MLFLFNAPLKAQVHLDLNINIGSQPVWGPVGYDYVKYYYMPDIEVYYSVPQGLYFYYEGGDWVSMSYLPVRYRDYDIYHSYKVVINKSNPWKHHNSYKKKYARYKGKRDQLIIRDSHDERYYVIKDHPQHGKWKGKDQGRVEERSRENRDNGNKHEKYNGSNHGNGKGKKK